MHTDVLKHKQGLKRVPKRLKSEREPSKYKNIWPLGNGLCFENKLQKETFYCFPLLGISKQQQEDIAVSPQYWARAAASKVVEQQASSKISNFPFWFSQNQKTNSILRKGFEIENSIAVMSPLNGHNKGPYKRSFWFQHLWYQVSFSTDSSQYFGMSVQSQCV